MRVRTRSRRAPVVVRSPLGNSNSRWSRQTRSVARKMNRATIAPDTNTIPKLWRSALTGENAPLMSSGPTTPHNRAAITQPVSDNTARKAGTITARRRRLALAGVSARATVTFASERDHLRAAIRPASNNNEKLARK